MGIHSLSHVFTKFQRKSWYFLLKSKEENASMEASAAPGRSIFCVYILVSLCPYGALGLLYEDRKPHGIQINMFYTIPRKLFVPPLLLLLWSVSWPKAAWWSKEFTWLMLNSLMKEVKVECVHHCCQLSSHMLLSTASHNWTFKARTQLRGILL